MGAHLRKKLRLFARLIIVDTRAEVSGKGAKRLGILFLMVGISLLTTNILTPHIANVFPLMANPFVETCVGILILALLLLILLRKTKSGKEIVAG